MRIRSTKPEFWRSKTIAQLDWSTRLVLKGLESYVDDNGVGKDDLALIAADVFPRDLSANPRETLARLSESISRLAEAGLIVRYTWDGEELIYIDKWKDIQRVDKPNKGRFCRPDGTLDYNEPVNRDSYRNPRETLANTPETLAPGTGEQRNRGTEEKDDDSPNEATHHRPPDAAADTTPAHIETTQQRTPPHANDAARTVVRQVLGDAGYPKTIRDRLAIQVTKLAREQHPDALIREALTEWDRRADCTKPEFLPTVLGDLVKRSRAQPGNNGRPPNKLRTVAELAQAERAKEHAALASPNPPELTT
ncbi:hypothetical protein NJB1604_35830 [Mycobacterium marinum]|uniref:hypothetical protein n=1 Tax=Mycobacterium marinum TaxID=1781 RepID=UPI0021C262DE|nr:hypothetical protein [Mycobacterium marinum]GJO50194.1 hypothetical protein NJB1604_35830 [Mycobacterium marinum]